MAADIRNLKGGLYLVVDPLPGLKAVLPKIKSALEGGVDIIQLWNNWREDEQQEAFIQQVCNLAHAYHVPVVIHEHWHWLKELPLDGVHFENIPGNLDDIKQSVGRSFLTGITCGNDPHRIQWAIANSFDYISFCSMYASATANSCELVKPSLVKETCKTNSIAVYAAGGITPDTIPSLLNLGISGVAVVSAIMKAENPALAATQFKQLLTAETNIPIV